ncbi:MAG: hypothetical protein WAW61_14185, partial [Methylococcaceae bacterium]
MGFAFFKPAAIPYQPEAVIALPIGQLMIDSLIIDSTVISILLNICHHQTTGGSIFSFLYNLGHQQTPGCCI